MTLVKATSLNLIREFRSLFMAVATSSYKQLFSLHYVPYMCSGVGKTGYEVLKETTLSAQPSSVEFLPAYEGAQGRVEIILVPR